MAEEARTFAIRAAAPAKHVLAMAATLHEAHQRYVIATHGSGQYALWSRMNDVQRAVWIMMAQAAYAHIASSSIEPSRHFPGGAHG